jgi:two-component system OmpR family response regulator
MTNAKMVYVADDEVNILNMIQSFLIKEGFEVKGFANGRALLEAFRESPADLVIVDVMMPELDGFSLCALLRQESNVPIIIVSAKDTEHDKIAGLTLGCDDYLTKPFSPMELMARIKSMFRRIEMDLQKKVDLPTRTIGNVVLNSGSKQFTCSDHNLALTGMEFALLDYLMTHKNRAISRGELLDKIWGFESAVETRATDDMIKRIRKKLSEAGATLKIETVWGFGFMVEDKELK